MTLSFWNYQLIGTHFLRKYVTYVFNRLISYFNAIEANLLIGDEYDVAKYGIISATSATLTVLSNKDSIDDIWHLKRNMFAFIAVVCVKSTCLWKKMICFKSGLSVETSLYLWMIVIQTIQFQ